MKIKLLLTTFFLLGISAVAVGQTEAVAVGDAAPDFELESLNDETVTLSQRFGEEGKPVVLLFSRASW